MENTLTPYQAVTVLPAASALVLAPHPDDEIFGCGGAIAAHVQSGVPVAVVILTDGALFGDSAARAQESRAAAAVLGYGEPEFWALPDRSLYYSEALVQRLLDKMAATGCDLLYAPSPWEIHPDHRQTSWLATEAVRRATHPVRIAFYEVGSPLRPNVLLDISASFDRKDEAMQCFGSQLAQQDYLRHIRALNQFRTYTLGAHVRAAEAYWLLEARQLNQLADWQLIKPDSAGVLAQPQALPVQLPRVSILIRSMDRPYLAAALDSVALQTYPNIEVVVIAAKPAHSPLPERCGVFPIRLIQTTEPLLRSRAANKALDAVSGDYALFLDDDDWLMPDHINRLVAVLSRQPHALSAYTGISLVDAAGQSTGQVFDLPFDGVRQLAGNMTPIHAVLFSAQALQRGCRFDETLDRYEDWDFWLQLSRLAPMVHLPGVSAAYRIHQSSGVHDDAGTGSASTATIYQKWMIDWSADQYGAIMHRVWTHPELETHIQDLNARLEAGRAGLDDARQAAQASIEAAARERLRAQEVEQEKDQLRQHLERSEHARQEADAGAAQATRQALDERAKAQAAETDLAEHKASLQRQAEYVAHLEDTIVQLRASSSWRITAPLRWLISLVR